MLWIYLITLQILFFVGLLFFLRYVLTRNISKATGHLHDLSKDYVSKEEEAARILQKAQSEAKSILAREAQAGEQAMEKILKEAQVQRDQIITEAHQRSSEITEKAQRNAEFVHTQLDQKIDGRAKEIVREMIHKVIPKEFLRGVHDRWLMEAEKGDLNLKHLKLTDHVHEAKVISAFPLTDEQKENLQKKLTKKVGNGVVLKADVDPILIAGYTIQIGSVVMDASLRYKIEKAMQE
jgi:ATP synthase F1 delta subunit